MSLPHMVLVLEKSYVNADDIRALQLKTDKLGNVSIEVTFKDNECMEIRDVVASPREVVDAFHTVANDIHRLHRENLK